MAVGPPLSPSQSPLPSPSPSPSLPEGDVQSLCRLLRSSTAGADGVPSLCGAIQSFLHSHSQSSSPSSPNSRREFFRLCFPLLLQRTFGFEDGGGGWLSLGSPAASEALVRLLSPGGTLFSSLLALDCVQFAFPLERLPDWVRQLLLLDKGPRVLSQVSEIFAKCINEDAYGTLQVQLDVFEYYIFWFAYYAVCKNSNNMWRGGSNASESVHKLRSSRSFGHWVSGLHHSFQQDPIFAPQHPYLHLLHLYLAYFVPSGPHQLETQTSHAGGLSRANFLVQTLVAFWLMAGDPSPLPLALRQSHGLSSFAGTSLAYADTGLELNEPLRALIDRLNYSAKRSITDQTLSALDSPMDFNRKTMFSFDSTLSPMVAAVDPPCNQYTRFVQRPLYRYILRMLHFWSSSSQVKKVSPAIDVWLDYLQPWFSLEDKNSGIKSLSVSTTHNTYMEKWQAYVISNYLYYTSLVFHFLEFALRLIHSDLEAVLQITCKVLSVLTASTELLDLLKKVDASCANHPPSTGRLQGSLSPLLLPEHVTAIIWEQYQDWEEGFPSLMNQADSSIHLTGLQQRNRHICLFSGGGQQALQMLLMQADAENQSNQNPAVSKAIETIRDVGQKMFDLPQAVVAGVGGGGLLPPSSQAQPLMASQALASPITVAFPKHTWSDVKYRGDWMRRPIESTEVALLVRSLVNASDWINEKLGLIPFTPTNETHQVNLGSCVKASLFDIWTSTQSEARRRGWRVNLRVLARKSYVSFLFLFLAMWTLNKGFFNQRFTYVCFLSSLLTMFLLCLYPPHN